VINPVHLTYASSRVSPKCKANVDFKEGPDTMSVQPKDLDKVCLFSSFENYSTGGQGEHSAPGTDLGSPTS